MDKLFEVEVDVPDGSVTVHFNGLFATSIARKLMGQMQNSYQETPPNAAFEAVAHQIGQGADVLRGNDVRGNHVGSRKAAETYPALAGKVFFDYDDMPAPPVEEVTCDSN